MHPSIRKTALAALALSVGAWTQAVAGEKYAFNELVNEGSTMGSPIRIADATAGPIQVTDKIACGIEGSVTETVYGLFGVRFAKKIAGSGTLNCVGHQPYKISTNGAGLAPGASWDLFLAFFRGEASSESESQAWSVQLALPLGLNPEVLGGTWKAQGGFDVGGVSFSVYVPSSITAPGVTLGIPTIPSLSAGISVSVLEVTVSQ